LGRAGGSCASLGVPAASGRGWARVPYGLGGAAPGLFGGVTRLVSRQVQGTGGSSAVSKCSAAERGYVQDRFVRLLVGRPRRRTALIHRGYYVRARAVDHCVQDFLLKTQSHPRTQILSLGAGFDSLYFRLKDMDLLRHTVIYEVDFPNVACQKATLIKRTEELSALVEDSGAEGSGARLYTCSCYTSSALLLPASPACPALAERQHSLPVGQLLLP
uniref:Leucine carboxyl methyltransferase 2 n=1 Tax=Gallus gallus TaxID=9031 RepID=A0A8V0X6K3_CHICK